MSALDNGDKHPRYWAAKGKRKIEGLAREETGTSAGAAEFTARERATRSRPKALAVA